jgi:hypothetical protein
MRLISARSNFGSPLGLNTSSLLLRGSQTIANPLLPVVWRHLRAEKILDKHRRGQLCLGTLKYGSKSRRVSTQESEGIVTYGIFLGDSNQAG